MKVIYLVIFTYKINYNIIFKKKYFVKYKDEVEPEGAVVEREFIPEKLLYNKKCINHASNSTL